MQTGAQTRTMLCRANGSHLSSSDYHVHIRLGDAASAKVTVHWTEGRMDAWHNEAADRRMTLQEGTRLAF